MVRPRIYQLLKGIKHLFWKQTLSRCGFDAFQFFEDLALQKLYPGRCILMVG